MNTEGYKEAYRWWEAIVLARKLMLQLVVVFIRDPLIQGHMCFVLVCSRVLTRPAFLLQPV
jgi:hypothetical protein